MMESLLPDDVNERPQPEFPTNYDAILERILRIDPIQYAKTRNFIDGSVTYLSPYISRGVISLTQVRQSVLNRGYKPHEIQKFLQELAWREYYQRVWQAKGDFIWKDLKQQQPGVLHFEMIKALKLGATGITIIDKQIEKLYSTGYMHNHCRMYVAAIACNTAKAHWLEPSRWMYYHLLDADIASNNCSWQWVAGAFAAKKYYCNQENINTYTTGTQKHTFLDMPYEDLPIMPVPEVLQATETLELKTMLPKTALPVLDKNKATLIYNAYNLDPIWRKDDNVNRVLLLEPSHFTDFPVSEKVISFVIDLSKNIAGLQLYCGEIEELKSLYNKSRFEQGEAFIAKEHPAFTHYSGVKDSRDWMFPNVFGYYPSFSSFWKQCERHAR